VGDVSGELTMNVSEDSIFSSPLNVLNLAVDAAENAKSIGTESVPVERLDDLLKNSEASSLAIKIDVQGFERQVLDGGPESLSRARIVELELTPVPVYDGQMLMLETIERLADAGLALSLTENLFTERHSGRALQFNGVFVRP
jgi:hypothetical protein